MRTGYSMLLGEFIDAIALEHRDCEPFQVVCPECYEPLFKVARAQADAPTQYLSHYQRGEAYQGDCELRAASKSGEEAERHNTQSRNQRLAYFLEVLKRAIARDPVMSYPKGLDHHHRQLSRAQAFRVFRNEHFEGSRLHKEMADPALFPQAAQQYLDDIGSFGDYPKTGFSTATQIRIAADVMRHLLTETGRSNYFALFNHGTCILIQRCGTPSASQSSADVDVLSRMAGLLMGMTEGGERRGMEVFQEMMRTPIHPPYVEQPATYALKIASEIGHEMIGALIRLPYFELLKEAKALGPAQGSKRSRG